MTNVLQTIEVAPCADCGNMRRLMKLMGLHNPDPDKLICWECLAKRPCHCKCHDAGGRSCSACTPCYG